MSELTTPIRIDITGVGSIESADLYIKSEVDKVIAEKDKVITYARALVREDIKLIRHQKYKRCLDKAALCKAMYDKEDASVNGRGASWDYTSDEMKYWERWRWRWDALADKFKEAK